MDSTVTKVHFTENSRNIGIFDSGVGGLWLMNELIHRMPFHNYYYFADSGFSPWGELSADKIIERSEKITRFLIDRGCNEIVVACNTATSQCIENLRMLHTQRIFGIEPAIKPASMITQTGVIGLLATEGTLGSERVRTLIKNHSKNCTVELVNFPGVVESIENGEFVFDKNFKSKIAKILHKFREQGIDTIILGCTHYRYFYEEILLQAQEEFFVVEPVNSVAEYMTRELSAFITHSKYSTKKADVTIFTTGRRLVVLDKYVKELFPDISPEIKFIADL